MRSEHIEAIVCAVLLVILAVLMAIQIKAWL